MDAENPAMRFIVTPHPLREALAQACLEWDFAAGDIVKARRQADVIMHIIKDFNYALLGIMLPLKLKSDEFLEIAFLLHGDQLSQLIAEQVNDDARARALVKLAKYIGFEMQSRFVINAPLEVLITPDPDRKNDEP